MTAEKLSKLVAAWQEHGPDKLFGGMTLAEFKTKVQPSFDARDAIAAADRQMKDAQNRRTDSDVVTQRLVQLVINSIKGDPTVGDDSSLYEAAGYVRKSERKSGLRRGSKTTAQPPA